MTRAGDSPLSPITAGFIKPSGRLRSLDVTSRRVQSPDWDTLLYEAKREGKKIMLYVEFDYLEDTSLSKESIWCMLIHICGQQDSRLSHNRYTRSLATLGRETARARRLKTTWKMTPKNRLSRSFDWRRDNHTMSTRWTTLEVLASG